MTEQLHERQSKNIMRAMRWAKGEIGRMPDHVQPFVERVLDLYRNGNVVLTYEVSEDASEEAKAEFWMNQRGRERVFGTFGDEYLLQVNLGTLKSGVKTWAQLDELITKTTA